jgi:hypothetical protein
MEEQIMFDNIEEMIYSLAEENSHIKDDLYCLLDMIIDFGNEEYNKGLQASVDEIYK